MPSSKSIKTPKEVMEWVFKKHAKLFKALADYDRVCKHPACVNRECIEARKKEK